MSRPKVGVMLPTLSANAAGVFEAARAADEGGLDGVFAFDHLWPMGRPGRPALWSYGVLGAVAAVVEQTAIGTLVARIDLLPEDDIVEMFLTLGAMVGTHRVIAGLGTGDELSAAENDAYGLRRPPITERLLMVERVSDRLRASGLQTWIGGNTRSVAESVELHADAQNLWGVGVERMARAGHVARTWGGQVLIGRDQGELADLRGRFGDRAGLVTGTVEEVADHLSALGAAGAQWCICAPLDYVAQPARAAETVCLVARAVR